MHVALMRQENYVWMKPKNIKENTFVPYFTRTQGLVMSFSFICTNVLDRGEGGREVRFIHETA